MGRHESRSQRGSTRALDPHSLRALAHPLRVQILGILAVDGPATCAGLARRLEVHSGAVSWHLSKLAEHELIQEIVDHGTRRERWWRATTPGWSVDAAGYLADPRTSADTTAVLEAAITDQFRRVRQFLDQEWDARWRESWILESSVPLRLDPDGLAAMRAELRAVLARYAEQRSHAPMAETVLVHLQGFPVRHDPDEMR